MELSAVSAEFSPVTDGLQAFAAPASVAVVGASPDPKKWGYWLTHGALKGTDHRDVYLVNRNGSDISGMGTYRSLSELPTPPELVAITVPGHAVSQVIKEALDLGSRAFLVISARVPDEDAINEMLEAHGARMIGPNSLGIYAAEHDLQLMWGSMRPGSLAIVSQSGQLGSEIAAHGAAQGVGISRFISLGNQTNVHAVDVLRSLINDSMTKTIGLYMEDFSRGAELFEVIAELRDTGTAVMLLTTGESEASADLAHSHTGAMTSSNELINAACLSAGAVRVYTPAELVQVASAFDNGAVPRGPRIAVISDSGGQGGIAADVATRTGLVVPRLSRRLRDKIESVLPEGASSRNPIDLAGAGEADLMIYSELAALLATSGEVDAVILSGYFGSYGDDTPALIETERAVAHDLMEITEVPVLIHAMAPQSMVSIELNHAGYSVRNRIEDIIVTLGRSYQATRVPYLTEEIEELQLTDVSDQIIVREGLNELGIAFPETRVVHTVEEAGAAAEELGGILVLKAAWLAHKTEHDGVRLSLIGVADVRDAFEEMYSRLGYGRYTLEVQDTREHIVEYIVSSRRDPGFGPVVTVGFGGTETEIWRDISVALGPISPGQAIGMINRLKSEPLLGQWRGRPSLDKEALAMMVSRLSHVLYSTKDLVEVELNPVRVGVDGALAVDCYSATEATE